MNVGGKLINDIDQLKKDVTQLNAGVYTATETVAELGVIANLTAVPGTFATLADIQTYLVTVRAEAEARLDSIEAKLDALIGALKTSNVIL